MSHSWIEELEVSDEVAFTLSKNSNPKPATESGEPRVSGVVSFDLRRAVTALGTALRVETDGAVKIGDADGFFDRRGTARVLQEMSPFWLISLCTSLGEPNWASSGAQTIVGTADFVLASELSAHGLMIPALTSLRSLRAVAVEVCKDAHGLVESIVGKTAFATWTLSFEAHGAVQRLRPDLAPFLRQRERGR